MKTREIIDKWYAELYDREETQTDDVDFMLSIIGSTPQNILEVCCGTGRILVPLAKAGHNASGFDMDAAMLGRIDAKAEGIENIKYSRVDAVKGLWGSNFDTVVLAGNILINIVSDLEYSEAQRLFIKKAYSCLKPHGHLYIDFNCFSNPEKVFDDPGERVVFEGTDSLDNYGKQIIFNGRYDEKSRIAYFSRKTEVTAKNGEKFVRESHEKKHIPTHAQVQEWLDKEGFKVISEFGDYNGNPINDSTYRAVIWAEKLDKTL